MGKKNCYNHRLLACIQRGKCPEGVDLPVIDPAAKVIEERSGKPTKPLPEKLQISDDRMVEIFEAWRRREVLKMKGLFVFFLFFCLFLFICLVQLLLQMISAFSISIKTVEHKKITFFCTIQSRKRRKAMLSLF